MLFLGSIATQRPKITNAFPMVFLGCLEDAVLGSATRAEGRHEGVVSAAQDNQVRVRPVQLVVK